MSKTAEKIRELGDEGKYEEAYALAKRALEKEPDNESILKSFRTVTGRLRSRCLDLACNKATEFSEELSQSEALLRKMITVAREDMHGYPTE